jgi:hypothetical protein
MKAGRYCWIFLTLLGSTLASQAQGADLDFLNHNRPMLDAHNCYPYVGRWNDRVKRALSAGFPVSIEQDLAWYVDPSTGLGRVVVSHTPKPTGEEPTLRKYFFEEVEPVVKKALAENRKESWPLIVLHFDFKDNQPALLEAVWKLLGEYEPWLSTAKKTSDPHLLSSMEKKPILVITEDSNDQEAIFYDRVPVGGKLLLFGSAHSAHMPTEIAPKDRAHWAVTASPESLLSEEPTNYRRWWNNSWAVVEEGGQAHAGDWNAKDEQRLDALVDHAHHMGYWIRFYTLDGFAAKDDQGWGAGYNFGSEEAVRPRWKAAVKAGVNFIATDQYEGLATLLRQSEQDDRPRNIQTNR